MMKFLTLSMVTLLGLSVSGTVLAQVSAQEIAQNTIQGVEATQDNAAAGTEQTAATAEAAAAAVSPADIVGTPFSESLFFSARELAAIRQAKQGYVAPAAGVQADVAVPVGPRSLKLAGIVYNSDKDWTIWFNGERVTPRNIPENIKGLIVKKDRIALRWFDHHTNRIISLVLRPHQQYHIDSDTITAGTR